MLRTVYAFITTRRYTSFQSSWGRVETAERLRNALQSRNWWRSALAGFVDADRVRLRRYTPFNTSLWTYRGTLVEENGLAKLDGYFAPQLFIRTILSVWFALVAIAGITMAAILIVHGRYGEAILAVIFCTLLIGFGNLVLYIMRWFARNDIAWLENCIRELLAASTSNCSSGGREEA